ncbi:hypothetical protein [Anaeromusa sp.]|uniref:hypothetical protein n=1 Tax=Anaeromusa sp. TaxID=1872520 RepID=UPI0026279AEC|nr:hypothetical protein [Anaeromusa sp.]MDD3157027.1 hypothetical protein [Anaeromusa sp.]
MSYKLLARRGKESERVGVVFDSGEFVWTTDTKNLFVGDGATSGGIPVSAPMQGLKNKLINGDFSYWQRVSRKIPVATRSRSNGVITVTTSIPHDLTVGTAVQHYGFGGTNYNRLRAITSVPSPTSYTIEYSATSAIASDMTSVQTTLTLLSDISFDTPPFNIKVDSEIMTVTGKSGVTLTVTRGVSGSTAVSHLAGARLYPEDEVTTSETGMTMNMSNSTTHHVGSPSTSFAYSADRWLVAATSEGGVATVSKIGLLPETLPGSPKYCLRWKQLTNGNNTSGRIISQRIESVRTLAGKKATFSFYAQASADGTPMSVNFRQCFGTGGSSDVLGTLKTLALTSGFKKYAFTFDIPSVADKTINSINSYLEVYFQLPNDYSNLQVDFALVQLEEGASATDFEFRHHALELMLCQRYYEKSYNLLDVPCKVTNTGQVNWYASGNAVFHQNHIYYKVQKRTTPTINLYSPITGNSGIIREKTTGAEMSGLAIDVGDYRASASINNTMTGDVYLAYHYTVDAEL